MKAVGPSPLKSNFIRYNVNFRVLCGNNTYFRLNLSITYQSENPWHISRIFGAVYNDIFGTYIHFTFLMQFMDTITLVDPEVCDVIR